MGSVELIVGVSRRGNGYVVTDSKGVEHAASSRAELGTIIAGLFTDGSVLDTVPLQGAQRIRQGAVEMVAGALPARFENAAPALVDVLSQAMNAIRNRSTKPKTRAPRPTGVRRVGQIR